MSRPPNARCEMCRGGPFVMLRQPVRAGILFVLWLACTGWWTPATLGAQTAKDGSERFKAVPKAVLVLHSYHPGYEWTDSLDASIREGLRDSPFDVEIRVEHMDTKRYSGDRYLELFASYFALKYEGMTFDVVIVTDDAALDFAVANHASLLHGAPVVFCGVGDEAKARAVPRAYFTGLIEVFSAGPIMEMALRLHHGRHKVLVVGDNSNVGEATLHQMVEVANTRSDLTFRFLDGRAYAFSEILDAVRQADDDTIVIASAFMRDRDGHYYPRDEANRLIAEASPAPVYSPSVSQLGQGIVGGSQNTGLKHGRLTAQIALRVLKGEPPASIPITAEKQDLTVFDAQQLRRWGVDWSQLPANAEIQNQPNDFYSRYRGVIWGGFAFIAFQTTVIGALIVAVVRRRKAEAHIQHQAQTLRTTNRTLEELNASLQAEIAERRRTEAEKATLQEQLHQAQKMDAVGQLAGGVAHDFNNLLSVILGHIELALETVQGDEPLSADLREVQTAGSRAATLTRQLLAFSRKQVLQPKPLDLNVVAAHMDQMLRPIIGEQVHLVRKEARDLGLTLADQGQIEQVLLNLMINARDAMPGGGTITLETAAVDIDDEAAARVGVPGPGHYVRLSVVDTGVGMNAETRSRVFEPFFTTKALGRGTGLGLSMAYGIVKQSGGGIAVESEPGKGARFDVYLPRVRGTAHIVVEPAIEPPGARGSETVLVVEDEAAVRRLVQRVLQGAGYHVLPAESGAQALEFCETYGEEIDLIVTDVVMPGISGPALAAQAGTICPRAKVLFMSGYADRAVADLGLPAAGLHFVSKPVSGAELTRRIRELLDGPNPAGDQNSSNSRPVAPRAAAAE